MLQLRSISIVLLFLAFITSASSSTADHAAENPTSLRGPSRRVVATTSAVTNDGTKDKDIVSALSKQFLHIAVGSINHLYNRNLENKSISPAKVSNVLREGMGCIYGESNAAVKNSNPKERRLQNFHLGLCLTKVLGSNRVIKRKGLVQKAFQLAARPLNARPDHVLPRKKADKVVTVISLISELAGSQAKFKEAVMAYVNAEVESGDIKMDQEALDGLDFFLTVANLGDE